MRLVVEGVVGSYGDEGLDLLKAFETIKKWHDYEMSSPRYQVDNYKNPCFEFKANWYTRVGGWDLVRIMVRQHSTSYFCYKTRHQHGCF
jgi:hypothetical protein